MGTGGLDLDLWQLARIDFGSVMGVYSS
jgi:hypothetical protein